MSSQATITPLSSLRTSRHQIPAHMLLPNTSLTHYPLLIYHAVFSPPITTSLIETHLRDVAVVDPAWHYTMYPTTHYHSTTHEVLVVSHGKATLCFGGEDNPMRVLPSVEEGDVIVVPAGLGHRLLEDVEGGFEMVGSYPVGSKEWDMCYDRQEDIKKAKHIVDVPWFTRDPIYGEEGPVLEYGPREEPEVQQEESHHKIARKIAGFLHGRRPS